MAYKIRVLVKHPCEAPYFDFISNELVAFQKAVGGYIETFRLTDDITVVCDEEGRLKEKEYCFSWGRVAFCGTCLFVGVSGDQFTDLPYDTMEDFYRAILSGVWA